MENRNRNPNSPFEHQTGRQEEMREKVNQQRQNQSYNYNSGNQRVRVNYPRLKSRACIKNSATH